MQTTHKGKKDIRKSKKKILHSTLSISQGIGLNMYTDIIYTLRYKIITCDEMVYLLRHIVLNIQTYLIT